MSSRLRVGFHAFSTYLQHPGRDGANFAYTELCGLLSESNQIDCKPHDLVALCESDDAARAALEDCDVVVSTVGPHAYFYCYLRERLNLRFRLIRDVRTALWNAYMLQEVLVAPYLRESDTVVHSSAYTRLLYRSLFPGLAAGSDHVCYPLLRWFPKNAEQTWRGSGCDKPFTIGYVGRLTEDKNFLDAVDLFAELRRRRPGTFRLRAIGEGTKPHGHAHVQMRLGTDMTGYEWYAPVNRDQIWRHYAEMDVLFFPSTSTLETFGRVLIEAAFVGTPILASEHGATSELLPEQALLHTKYNTTRRFNMHDGAPLGQVAIDEAVELLLSGVALVPSHGHGLYTDDARRFLELVLHGNGASQGNEKRNATERQCRFVRTLSIDNLGIKSNASNIDAAIASLRAPFVILSRRIRGRQILTLLHLLYASRNRRKTLNFAIRNLIKGEDFTNIGGVDLQFSHLIEFYPSFTLSPSIKHTTPSIKKR